MSEKEGDPRHHPSCTPLDNNLLWYCNQCGIGEPILFPAINDENMLMKLELKSLRAINRELVEMLNSIKYFPDAAAKPICHDCFKNPPIHDMSCKITDLLRRAKEI